LQFGPRYSVAINASQQVTGLAGLHILLGDDFLMVLANPAHVKNVPGRMTDVSDAHWLAALMADGLIRASYVPHRFPQQMRDLLGRTSNWCASAPATQCASRRYWKTPTSS